MHRGFVGFYPSVVFDFYLVVVLFMLAVARSLLGVAGGFTSFPDIKHTLFSNYKSIGRFIQMVHRHVCCIVFVGGKPDEALSMVGVGLV
jgi:hypothetical protein